MWTVDGSAYDFTALRDTHPGGAYIIDALRDQDCTAVYFSSHPCVGCEALRRRIRPYRQRTGPPDPAWRDTRLYDDLKARVRAYRHVSGTLRAPPTAWLWYAYWARWFCVLAPSWLAGTASVPAMLALGWTLWILFADLTHSGTHGAVARMPRAGWADAALVPLRWLCAPFCVHGAWVRQHILGHHAYTNTGSDPDLHHHPRERVGWRVAPWTAATAAYRKWRASFALGLWATQLQPCLANAAAMVWSGRYPGAHAAVRWVGAERPWCALQTAAMWWLVGWLVRHHGPAALTPFATCGALFYGFSQVSHINAASFAEPAAEPAAVRNWAVHQVRAAAGDYATLSPLATLVSIGLNQQALHHLFPTVHPFHYTALTPSFCATLKRHGVAYRGPERTYGDALRDHLGWLHRLNTDLCTD
jgi:linoleoyl-CoA desaturase